MRFVRQTELRLVVIDSLVAPRIWGVVIFICGAFILWGTGAPLLVQALLILAGICLCICWTDYYLVLNKKDSEITLTSGNVLKRNSKKLSFKEIRKVILREGDDSINDVGATITGGVSYIGGHRYSGITDRLFFVHADGTQIPIERTRARAKSVVELFSRKIKSNKHELALGSALADFLGVPFKNEKQTESGLYTGYK